MTTIQFEEEPYPQARREDRKSFLIRSVLATGIVSNDTQAKNVLLVVALLGFVVTVLILSMGNKANGLSNADIERITEQQQGAHSPLR